MSGEIEMVTMDDDVGSGATVAVDVPLSTFTPAAAVADDSVVVVDEAAADANAGLLGGKSKRRVYIDRTPALNFVVELFGTTILCLVIFICRGTVDKRGTPAAGLTGVALAHGWALASLAGMFGKLSGAHFNPAVTLTMVLTKQMSASVGGFYCVAQFVGAAAASALCIFILPPTAQMYHPGTGLSAPIACGVFPDTAGEAWGACWMKAFGAEFLGTLLLIMTILMTAVAGHSKAAHVSIGFSLVVGVSAFGPVSNACFNPARSFGAALTAFGISWSTQWVWLIAPFLSSIVASILFLHVFQVPEDKSKKSIDR